MQLLILSLLAGASLAAPMKELVKEHKTEVHGTVVHAVNPLQLGTYSFAAKPANHVLEYSGDSIKTGVVGTPSFGWNANAVIGTGSVVGANTHAVIGVPGVTTYNAGFVQQPAVATNLVSGGATTYNVADVKAHPVQVAAISTPVVGAAAISGAPVFKSVSTGHHAVVAAPAVATQAIVAPAVAKVAAVPSAVTYQSEHTVQLAPKEVDVQVQHHTVHVPVEKRVHYGVQNVVTGSQTTVHKPHLSAAAIAAPAVFKDKVEHKAPEVTVTHSQVTVENKTPIHVDAPYDAGVVEEKAAPVVKNTDVHVPVKVDVPYKVPHAVPYTVEHPVKIKNSVTPVQYHDVHTVNTENVVTPIEYAQHHHVVKAPVVANTVHQTGHLVATAPAVTGTVQLAQNVQQSGHFVAPAAVVQHGAGQVVAAGHANVVPVLKSSGHQAVGHQVVTGHQLGAHQAVVTGHQAVGAHQAVVTGHQALGGHQTVVAGHQFGANLVPGQHVYNVNQFPVHTGHLALAGEVKAVESNKVVEQA